MATGTDEYGDWVWVGTTIGGGQGEEMLQDWTAAFLVCQGRNGINL